MNCKDSSSTTMLSIADAVEYMESRGIKRSASWLRNAEKQRLIGSKLTDGGHRRYSRDDLDELVTSGEVKRYVLVLTTPDNALFVSSDASQKKWIKSNTSLIPKGASIRANSLTCLTTDLIGALNGRNISAVAIKTAENFDSKLLAITQQLISESQRAIFFL